ncbi:MAG: RcnB family protein [Sphingomonas sp.]|nr:RcnB family protein [Sphingomonas sp.]
MKKFLLSAIAISMVATPTLAAPQRDDYRGTQRTVIVKKQVYRGPPARIARPAYRAWQRGQRFDYRRAPNYRVLNDYRSYRLQAPPRGYRYVRSGNDAILVGTTSGLIAAVIAGALR